MSLMIVLAVLGVGVLITSRRSSMVPAWRGDRVSDKWLLDHVYAHGKRGGL